jgi:hypothetical protein
MHHDQTFTESTWVVHRLYEFMLSLNRIYGSGLRSGLANTGKQPFSIQLDAEVTRPFKFSGTGEFERGVAAVNLGAGIYPIRSSAGSASVIRNGRRAGVFSAGLNQKYPFSRPILTSTIAL